MDNKGCCGPKDNSCSTTGKQAGMGGCWMTLLKGMLLGGFILFAYFSISWALIPAHKSTLVTYTSTTTVEAPSVSKAVKNFGKEVKAAMSDETTVVETPMAKPMAGMLLLCLFGGLALTKMLKKICGCPVGFSLATGLLVGTFGYLPALIWFAAPLNFTLMGIADDAIAFTLAGWAISKIVLKCSDDKTACN